METKEVYILVPVKMILAREDGEEGYSLADVEFPTKGDVWKADSFNGQWYDSKEDAFKEIP